MARACGLPDRSVKRSDSPRAKRGASLRKAGRPRKAGEVRQVYSVRLPPALAQQAQERAGGLTPAVELALAAWLAQSS